MRTKIIFIISSLALSACGGSSPKATGFQVQGMPAHASAGDAIPLTVVQTFADGTTGALPSGATVTWAGVPTVTALAPDSTADSPIPAPTSSPTAFFLSNPSRTDEAASLANTLFIRDTGTGTGGSVALTGTVAGSATGTVTASLTVGGPLTGDAGRGATAYASACADCHGMSGHGTDAGPNGKFTIDGMDYNFPAPGLNAEAGNAGGDPDWDAGIFALAARVDMDDGGVALRQPMPSWLTTTSPSTHALLSTQDLADIYAFMQTQMQ